MAHGLNSVLKRPPTTLGCKSEGKTGVGSRRIFAPHFKLQVLDSYRNDADCKGNQRATARKYGIHRRQIQKWLQVENNLRNSVYKGKLGDSPPLPQVKMEHVEENRKFGMEMALSMGGLGRQRDDIELYSHDGVRTASAGIAELRVPALNQASEANACLAGAPRPLDFSTHSRTYPAPPEAPMDLSCKKSASLSIACGLSAPVPCLTLPPSPSPPPSSLPHPDVWDLSTKSAKRKSETAPHSTKPVKLFKPYLDDFNQDTSSSSEESKPHTTYPPQSPPNADYYYYNHNNNICEIKAECTYTIQELQPKGSINYYYNYPPAFSNNEFEPTQYCCANYDETYPTSSGLIPLKQRQSYSLDFKLRAIECYYEDSVCKGNQRAVANKYNIHRRQVQKWLKQEDELRQRCETVKHMHVR